LSKDSVTDHELEGHKAQALLKICMWESNVLQT